MIKFRGQFTGVSGRKLLDVMSKNVFYIDYALCLISKTFKTILKTANYTGYHAY